MRKPFILIISLAIFCIQASLQNMTVSFLSGMTAASYEKAGRLGLLFNTAVDNTPSARKLNTSPETVPTLTSVSIASNNPTSTLAKPDNIITLKFTASEPIKTPVVTIATHSVTTTASANNTFTAKYTMLSTDVEGLVPFTIDFTSTANVAGTQVTTTTNGTNVTYDKTPPTVVSINRLTPLTEATSATSVVYRVTFSEKAGNVDVSDFTATTVSGDVTGTVSAVAIVSTKVTYNVTISSITGSGVLRLDLKPGTDIKDAAYNIIAGGYTSGQTYTITAVSAPAPTLTAVSITSNNATSSLAIPGDVVNLSFTSSEPINTPVVSIATHTATATAGANNSFTAAYTMTGADAEGTVPFTIDFSNTAGTPGTQVTTTTNGSSVTFDKTAPAVLSISRQSPLTASTTATSVTYRITFSEGVSGVDPQDFSLTAVNGSVTGTIAGVTTGTTNAVYDVVINAISGSGNLRLDLNASGTGIADQAGNVINTGFTTGDTYTIQQAVPTLTSVSITSNNATPSLAKTGNVVTVSFTASEPINTPIVTIATHTISATAGANNSFTAPYTLASTDAEGVVPFTIDFSNTSGASGTQVSATTNGSSVRFDKTPPAVTSISRQSPLTSTTSATSVTYRVAFSESVSGVDGSDFTLTVVNGSVTGTISGVSAVGTTNATYDVTISSLTGSGTIRLDLNATGTGIADATGNAISSGYTAGDTYTIQPVVQPGFVTITPLNPIVSGVDTKEKPQAKVWSYAGKWWCVVPAANDGTKIFRLDGTSWTPILKVNSSSGRADCIVVGDLVHILLYRGASKLSYVISAQYDAISNTYKFWSKRPPASSSITFPAGSETATLTVDGTGRMWLATESVNDVFVWWSDSPYTTWSAPIRLVTGIYTDDICAITKLPGKIGIFWSNQNTGLFGFKTHNDGSAPDSIAWSADEKPASQSAIPGLPRMADDHMNMQVASDGTLYCAAKTSYNNVGYPQLILLVRRPSGTWDNLYPVTVNEGTRVGTQAIVLLNEALSKIKVVFTTATNGGDIVCKESPMSNISFGSSQTLIGNGSPIYNFATSTHQGYNPDVVIMATDLSATPYNVVSVLASDAQQPATVTKVASPLNRQLIYEPSSTFTVFPVPVQRGMQLTIQGAGNALTEVFIADAYGRTINALQISGTAFLDTHKLNAGIYYIVWNQAGHRITKKIMVTD